MDDVERATALGFEAVSANDHLVFGRPWLDGRPPWRTDDIEQVQRFRDGVMAPLQA